jgi:putative redox protein
MSLRVSMSYVDDQKFKITNQTENQLLVDMYSKEKKEHLSPMELLLSALTTCAAVEIVSMIKKRKRNFTNIKAETTGLRVENPPKFFKSINVKYLIYSSDLTKKEAERYISLSLEKYCSVGSTINQKIAINHSFEIVR